MRDTSDWPATVPILSVFETIDNQYDSPWVDGYPVDILGWVDYSFPNHEHRIEFWKLDFKVYTVFEKERTRILNLMSILSEQEHIQRWNTRIRVLWNTVMALLGYTEGQSDRALKVAEYMKTNTIFQKLDVVVGCRNGIYYPIARYLDGVEITVNKVKTISRKDFNAEEETSIQKDYSARSSLHRSTNTKRQGTTSRRQGTQNNQIRRPKPPSFHQGRTTTKRS